MKTKTTTTEEKQIAKNESNLGFKKGMLGMFVTNRQANIKKRKGKKTDRRNPPKKVVQKGVDGQKAKEKDGNFEREDRRKTRKNRTGRKGGF